MCLSHDANDLNEYKIYTSTTAMAYFLLIIIICFLYMVLLQCDRALREVVAISDMMA